MVSSSLACFAVVDQTACRATIVQLRVGGRTYSAGSRDMRLADGLCDRVCSLFTVVLYIWLKSCVDVEQLTYCVTCRSVPALGQHK